MPGWPSRRGGLRWSNSTAASAIRKPSPCSLYWKPRWGSCCAPPPRQLAAEPPLRWRDGYAVTVVVAAENYPGRPRVGDVIHGAEADGVLHAGTARRDDGEIVSSGGRVLSIVGTGPDLVAARESAYTVIKSIRLPGSHFRSDIGLAAAEGRISL